MVSAMEGSIKNESRGGSGANQAVSLIRPANTAMSGIHVSVLE
jgi:hypothetical protein